MKKTLIIVLLVLVMVSSMVCGTFAVYTTNQDITSGDLTAKTMILKLNKISGFDDSLNIAPTESCEYIFNVTNTAGSAVTKVPVDATVTVSVEAADGKQPIGNLSAELYENGEKIADIPLAEGVGSIDLGRYFGLTAKTLQYRVVISWMSQPDDNDYIGSEFGNVVVVNVSGVQATEEPEEPESSYVERISDYIFSNRNSIFVANKSFTIRYGTVYGGYLQPVNGGQKVKDSADNLVDAMEQFLDELNCYDMLYVDCYRYNDGSLRIVVLYYEYVYGYYYNTHSYDKMVDVNGNLISEDLHR